MNVRNFIFVSLLISLPNIAYSGDASTAKSYNSVWGGNTIRTCGTHSLPDTACIGNSYNSSASNGKKCPNNLRVTHNAGDEYSISMMIARKVNTRGAYFCPTQLEARNKHSSWSWTEYTDPTGAGSCVWLCREGYTGTECSVSVSSYNSDCSATNSTVKQNDYSGIEVKNYANSTNIENSVAMFEANIRQKCSFKYDDEHDLILIIEKYLPSGHGAYVRQYVAKSQGQSANAIISYPVVYAANDKESATLVCLPGYKQQNGDCVQIVTKKCEEQQMLQKLCSGWSASGYNSSTHNLIQLSNDGCYVYNCKKTNYGLSGKSSGQCEYCKSRRKGINSDGLCVTCANNEVWDDFTRSCKETVSLTLEQLKYGINGEQSDLESQCWTRTDPDAFRKCVFAGPKK